LNNQSLIHGGNDDVFGCSQGICRHTKDELESIQAFLKDAYKRAESAEGNNTSEGVKTRVK